MNIVLIELSKQHNDNKDKFVDSLGMAIYSCPDNNQAIY
jgi:hypothetical protein